MPARERLELEREALSSGDGLEAFEPGINGEMPILRVRRIEPGKNSTTDVDIRFIVADRLTAFQALWGDEASHQNGTDPWDTSLLFYETLPETVDYRIRVGERPDKSSRAVSFAVARAAGHEAPLAETYSFDPDLVRPVLLNQQLGAQWLVLISRNPIYRAVQRCADAVTLLDFSSQIEVARPVHVCVSIGKDRQDQCVAALGNASRRLLGDAFISPNKLLERARLLAPGLALPALASESVALEGLLGLLLTERELSGVGRLVLSLDQHPELLSGTGILADLIYMSVADDSKCVVVDISEAKFTLGDVAPTGPQIAKAIRQLNSTVDRLQRFGVSNPLSTRTRAALVRAAVQQIHLLDRTIAETQRNSLLHVLGVLRDRDAAVHINPISDAVVHVWSCGPATENLTNAVDAPKIVIHGRAATLEALRRL